jgi:putative RNA 2'-phosphotransferase
MPTSQQERSKYLSYLLRHKPEAAHLTLDKEGWCDLEELLKNTDFTLTELESIVAADAKTRYAFKFWEMAGESLPSTREPIAIRANQGHSTDSVRMTFNKAVPPVQLFHGTNVDAWPTIQKTGLLPMSRHHVHLSPDVDTAMNVGGRRRKDIVLLKIDAKNMLADGFTFFLSDNGVWLVPAVPAKYVEQVQ